MNKMERCAVGKSIFVSITFSEKRKEKLKSSTKATIEANIFPVCNFANGKCKFCLRNYRNYNHTYIQIGNGSFFFFFFSFTMIHYSWILPTKRCTIQNYNKVEEEEKSGISPFWALPRYRFSANLDSRILVRGSKDKRGGWRIVAIHFENCTRKNRVFNRGPLRAKNLDDLSR